VNGDAIRRGAQWLAACDTKYDDYGVRGLQAATTVGDGLQR
jgi:hypothetical protein